MEKLYFLSGLGNTEKSTEKLNEGLNKYGYNIHFIDLPGQYSNFNVNIKSESDFINWLKGNIPTDSLVMAFSMGADLLIKYNKYINPKKMIILDGGIIGYDFDDRDLEEDIQFTRNYIFEHKLNMNADTIEELIRIIENEYKDIFNSEINTDTLFLVADSPEEVFDYKKKKINKYEESDQSNICIKVIEDTTHHLYIEKPNELAKEIGNWLNKEGE